MPRLRPLPPSSMRRSPAQGVAVRAALALMLAPVMAGLLAPPAARAGEDVATPAFTPDAALLKQVTALARGGASQLAPGAAQAPDVANAAPGGVRVDVQVGKLDPRLRLAPCARIETYLPPGMPLWGASRVGLKCVQGPKAWNVSLPVTVHVYGRSTVATTNLAPGTVLEADMLSVAEVDLAAAPGAAVMQPGLAVGRTLSRPVVAGGALRQTDLKPRQWFAAGETVHVVAGGNGWRVVTDAQAVSAGIEGQVVRVRTDSGRLLTARPTADHQVELTL